MPKVLVPLADGCEEMEAVILLDTLRRAGWDVVGAGLHAGEIRCSRGVRLIPDAVWDEVPVETFDMLVLPGGGPGTDALRRDPRILDALRAFHAGGKTVAAICAGPLVLQEAGLLKDRKATCHPGVAGELTQAQRVDDAVVTDGTIVTSQGPGTAFAFALELVRRTDGPEAADRIGEAMVLSG
jgi:4-methyl-5(b-hydroxyethyl)-thiazole monophosphate biosynthesis